MKRTRRIVLLSLAALALIVTGMQIEKAVADQSTARLEMLQPQWWDVVNADGFPIIARSGNWPTGRTLEVYIQVSDWSNVEVWSISRNDSTRL